MINFNKVHENHMHLDNLNHTYILPYFYEHFSTQKNAILQLYLPSPPKKIFLLTPHKHTIWDPGFR